MDDTMKGKIQTVLGPIEAEECGATLTHEHLLHDLPWRVFEKDFPLSQAHISGSPFTLENLGWTRQYPYSFEENLQFSDVSVRDAVLSEMKFLKQCGGSTVVDNGSIGLRAKDQAQFLQNISKESGINIVAGTGFYVLSSQSSSTLTMTQEEMENQIKEDLFEGIGGSNVKCGVIGEIGCSYPLYDFEKRSLSASAAVQEEYGCPVIIHPGRDRTAPEEIIRIFQESGGKACKTVMSHLERTLFALEDLLQFASLGTFCEYDLFGVEVSHYQQNVNVDMPSDAQRLASLLYLVEQGYGDRIVLSHDIHTKHRLLKFGGHGYSHIILNIRPKMLTRGFTESDVNKILYDNPKNWLTYQ